MSVWAIKQGYRFEAFEVIKETERMVFYNDGREYRAQKIDHVRSYCVSSGGFLPWRGTEQEAKAIAEKLMSIRAERDKRQREANDYMVRECARLLGSDS